MKDDHESPASGIIKNIDIICDLYLMLLSLLGFCLFIYS